MALPFNFGYLRHRYPNQMSAFLTENATHQRPLYFMLIHIADWMLIYIPPDFTVVIFQSHTLSTKIKMCLASLCLSYLNKADYCQTKRALEFSPPIYSVLFYQSDTVTYVHTACMKYLICWARRQFGKTNYKCFCFFFSIIILCSYWSDPSITYLS